MIFFPHKSDSVEKNRGCYLKFQSYPHPPRRGEGVKDGLLSKQCVTRYQATFVPNFFLKTYPRGNIDPLPDFLRTLYNFFMKEIGKILNVHEFAIAIY